MSTTAVEAPVIREEHVARLARNFSIWGSAVVVNLTPAETIVLVERLDVPAEQLFIAAGVLRRDMKQARSTAVCTKKKETMLEDCEWACKFCGHSALAHGSIEDPPEPVKIQSGAAK